MRGRTEDLCTAVIPVQSVGFTRLSSSQRPVLGGLHALRHLDYTGGRDHSHSLHLFFIFLNLTAYQSISPNPPLLAVCNDSVFPSMEGSTGRSHEGKVDELLLQLSPTDSSAVGPSPRSLHLLLFLTLSLFYSFPCVSSSHPYFLLVCCSLLLSDGAEGTLYVSGERGGKER